VWDEGYVALTVGNGMEIRGIDRWAKDALARGSDGRMVMGCVCGL
jgi:hypothetical protein